MAKSNMAKNKRRVKSHKALRGQAAQQKTISQKKDLKLESRGLLCMRKISQAEASLGSLGKMEVPPKKMSN